MSEEKEDRVKELLIKSADELKAAKILSAVGLEKYSLIHIKRSLNFLLQCIAELYGVPPSIDLLENLNRLKEIIVSKYCEEWVNELYSELDKESIDVNFWNKKLRDLISLIEEKKDAAGVEEGLTYLWNEGIDLKAVSALTLIRESVVGLLSALRKDPVKILILGAVVTCIAAIVNDYVLHSPSAQKLYSYTLYLIALAVLGRIAQAAFAKFKEKKGAPAGI